jgi:hypothetical protein
VDANSLVKVLELTLQQPLSYFTIPNFFTFFVLVQ